VLQVYRSVDATAAARDAVAAGASPASPASPLSGVPWGDAGGGGGDGARAKSPLPTSPMAVVGARPLPALGLRVPVTPRTFLGALALFGGLMHSRVRAISGRLGLLQVRAGRPPARDCTLSLCCL
jgi:hypothetical protein